MESRLSGFVLAGGQSRRMGVDKARLEIGGRTMLLRMLDLLRPHVDSVAVLGAAGKYDFVRDLVIPDSRPGDGPLAAILNGLEHSATDWAIFLACDMPLLNRGFIELLTGSLATTDSDAVIARTRSGWQPLCAAYRQTSVPTIRRALAQGESSIVRVLPRLRVHAITGDEFVSAGIDETTFENVNGPGDWERILQRMNSGAG